MDGMDPMDGYARLCDQLSNMSLSKMEGISTCERCVTGQLCLMLCCVEVNAAEQLQERGMLRLSAEHSKVGWA